MKLRSWLATAWLLSVSVLCYGGELAGHKILITSVRTGDTEVFVVDPDMGDALEQFVRDADGKNVRQLTHFNKITCPAAWSPDGKWISLRVTDNAFWRDPTLMAQTYAEKRGDKPPVWVIGADGSNPHVIEVLRYQCAIDGSRASWKPR